MIMKNLSVLLFLFFLPMSVFANTKIGYYPLNQTRSQVLENVKTFEKDMFEYKYSLISQKIANKYDYTQSWSYESSGATSLATVRYQFLEDRVLVTMTDAMFISKEGTKIPLQESDPTEVKRKVYESLENIYFEVFFEYLKCSESNPKNSASSSGQRSSILDFQRLQLFATTQNCIAKSSIRSGISFI